MTHEKNPQNSTNKRITTGEYSARTKDCNNVKNGNSRHEST